MSIIDRIRALNVPEKVKADLLLLATRARRLVERILDFISRNRHFSEAVMIGAIAAFALNSIPFFGHFLALCALITAAAIGVLRQIHADLAALFAAG